ncbi:MAG: AraC family transcriptional regulator [Oscillospiraceae bacterium]|nr:AraC family transcriptional regulator [Oscillospiraceae bacterium]
MNILEEFNSEEVYTRYAVDEKPADDSFTMHVHERCEIYCFVSGEAEYLVEGTRYPLKAGSVLIMRPAESHKPKILGSGKYERYAVNFSLSFVERLDPRRILMSPFFERPLGRGNLYGAPELGGEVLRLFGKMCRGGKGYERQLEISTRLFLLLEMIYKSYLKRGTAEYAPPTELSEQLVTYVNNHIFEELSIPMLAENFFLSASQFGRVFRQATGATPWEYIIIKRLTAAREKIRCGEPAGIAAESCGFSDYSAFYRAYVKRFGCSPKDDMK